MEKQLLTFEEFFALWRKWATAPQAQVECLNALSEAERDYYAALPVYADASDT